jgi:membrane protein DedA with SNARE-associated domain
MDDKESSRPAAGVSAPAQRDPIPDHDLRRRRAICAGVLLLQGLYALVGLGAIPSLIGRDPVLLEALRGSTAAMVAGGAFARVGRASLVLAVLAPFPTLMMSDPFVWWAGRLWGPDVVELVAGRGAGARRGTQRALALVERSRSWAIVGAYVLPIPSIVIYAAAGWTGMPLVRFLALDLLGTLLWVGLIVGLGYALGHPAVGVAHTISHYGLLFTIALVVVAVAISVWRARRMGPGDPGDRPDPLG